MKRFPFYRQLDTMDCGPACLRMIAKYYGKRINQQTLREKSFITREGVSLQGLSTAAESIGFRTLGVKITYEDLEKDAPLPCIVYWKQRHFIIAYKIKKDKVYIADPSIGLISYSTKEFLQHWGLTQNNQEIEGICLLFETTQEFFETKDEVQSKNSLRFLLSYIKPYRKLVYQLIIGLLISSLLQLIFPFLTQSIIDVGVITHDLNFIYLVLISQLVLFVSRMFADIIRSWILLHISSRINISLISDFLLKLMRLPIRFFDVKMIGDLVQRIQDNYRIENFLTSSTLNILFSLVNILIFGVVLFIYNIQIFFIYVIGSILYLTWIFFFIGQRKILDYKKFEQLSLNQSKIYQLLTGMQEIKLNNCENSKRWEWEKIQARLFKVNIKSLELDQYQETGATFINEVKNIITIFLSAQLVLTGDMTLGAMLSIQYILGQTDSSIQQVIKFLRSYQDAKLSIERLREVHTTNEEEDNEQKIKIIPDEGYNLEKVSFRYAGPESPKVLDDINLTVVKNKITAIVGSSGSGKTTLIKLLLGFYQPQNGSIKIGTTDLSNIDKRILRQKSGAILQDGFVFSDTIANNISVSDEVVDIEKLLGAVKTANIQDFIEELPLGYNTKIGNDGIGLSQGQKQRILIARAIYKNPKFLFFDEATNALDANNEKVIMKNLSRFFKGRTVIVVAHRLSTVKDADQIAVMEKGKIIELGKHDELIKTKGMYYKLVKNQLELGN